MGRVVRLGAVSREETPTAAMRSLILSVVLVGFATPAFAQAVCGGHYITYIGGLPTATPDFRTYIGGPPTATPRIRQHGPPTLSEPSGMTAQDRALWDALIFDAYEHPTPSPDAEDYWRSSIPLEERHTRVMDTGDATSFGLCIQEADESYTGERLEQYDSAWWRGEVQRFTNGRWTGTLEVGTCTGDPPAGWVYVREGDPGEVDDDSIAHTVSWYSRNIHGTVETWVKSEIVFHSERKVRNTSEAYFKVTLAHELGHVLGLSHVPPSSSFVMAPGTLSTWPDQESRLAQLAHQVGAGFEYPGFGPANTPATGAPTITGTARVDETLTAVTTGIMDADGLASPSYTYQWIRVETDSTEADISGATSGTYTLAAADEGKTIKVKVSFTDDASNPEMRTSAATGTVAAANTPATGAPTITGTARVDETLTAVTTGIMDADGLASPTYTYQWIRVDGGTDADISGATSSTYTLVAADEGKTIKVKVSFTDDASNPEMRTSAATATVAAATTPTISAVAVTSTPQLETDTYGEGEDIQFTVTFSEAVKVTGMPRFVFSLGNSGDGRQVNAGYDAAASTDTALVFAYTVVSTDKDNNGIYILDDVTVSGTAGSGSIVLDTGQSIVGKTSEVPASLAHSVRGGRSGHKVDGSPNSPATGAPTITGTAKVGETLTAVTTGIMDADGVTSVSYTYQWIRVETDSTEADISGATSGTYTLVAADEGKTIKVKVSFTDDASNPETLTSAATATVAATNNPATGSPTITGTARVDETLTAVTTGIMDADGLASPTYTYQWIRVDGGTDADISGATSSTYTLVAADEGRTIKVKVSFTDDASNPEMRTSAATGTVAAANTPRDGGADDHGHGAGGRDADGGHHRHHGRRRAGQPHLHLPVDPGGRRHGCRHFGSDVEHLHAGRRQRRRDDQGAGDLRGRRQQCRDAHQRGHGDGRGQEHPRDGRADDHGHGAGGRDADGGHHRHHGRRRAGQPQLHLPVDPGRDRQHRDGHLRGDVEHLHPGRRRRGQDDQGQGELHRRRQQSRDAHQRGHGDGGGGGDDADDLGGGGHLHAAA